ncbi:MAG: metal ABC transporter substrate-binding protein, partial [Microbacteriaceae bacterium]|nr:metal ABC transporter substrate-binding protein [Microbacteriaceae bacterium]
MKKKILAMLAMGALLLSGCTVKNDSKDGHPEGTKDGKLTIFATTGYLADAAKNIAPDAEITTMVGPGGDPHTYQPTPQDIEKMQKSAVVLWNGLHLEAQMVKQLESLGNKQLAVGTKVDKNELLPWEEEGGHGNNKTESHDPHIWNSPKAWSQAVTATAAHLAKIDPKNAEKYTKNGKEYVGKIES